MVRRAFVFVAVLTFALLVPAAFAGDLEIHVINVEFGSSVLIRGPNGTTVLMDAGENRKGAEFIKPYLKSLGISPKDGLDYTITGHLHDDHIGGFDEVVGKGSGKYDVHTRNYYNGSTYHGAAAYADWYAAAKSTTAKRAVVMQVGTQIPLGDGAMLTCVARNGRIIGGKRVAIPKADDENDRSIAVVVQYGGFDYFWASDLSGRKSSDHVDLESEVIKAILPHDGHQIISEGGIDVLQVGHHGSETSTNLNLIKGAVPAVAIISVGEDKTYQLPRKTIVDQVLGGNNSGAGPLVLQTEEGAADPSKYRKMSDSGYSVGDIVIRTNGKKTFTVEADGKVYVGKSEVAKAQLPRTFDIDEVRNQ